ncbi:hypothetical protein ACO0LL_20780 [Undibacterium sp. TC4M20W]|uniref:hypothetical protein n=1 Tax=Undibacterium sp. TC4M20W TaxID=3413052 RepID=UPI003BF1D852
MTTMPNTTALNTVTTVDSVVSYLSTNGIDNKAIWAHLDRTDRIKVKKLLSELDAIDAEIFDKDAHKPLSNKQFQADKSGRKGKKFEELTTELLQGLTCFKAKHNVFTDVNQIDVLVTLQPNASIVPSIRKWGDRIICECKFHDKGVSVDWVEKLATILGNNSASVGILISKKGIARKGPGANTTHLLHLLAVQGKFIISLSRNDLEDCVNGSGLLELLVDRYVEVGMGIPQFMR